jgi:transcriptional regulator with AAA-type ATPase domain
MARPTKHNVDYFSHDCDMRNDIKIKALRRKYKHLGYSIYNITLELLGDTEYFQMKWDDTTIELLTADYDCDIDELKEVINYCIQLNLFQLTHDYLHCDNFTKRLEETVLSRRKDYFSNNSPISKLNEVNVYNNEVNVDNNTQSKVKESKVNKSKGEYSKEEESKLNKTGVEESTISDTDYHYLRNSILQSKF